MHLQPVWLSAGHLSPGQTRRDPLPQRPSSCLISLLGQQPTRPLCLWDSPGKNTRVGCHFLLQCMKVKSESEVAQLCPTLSDPMDCSLPGSSIHGIFQARVLEWGAIAFSGIMYYVSVLRWTICFTHQLYRVRPEQMEHCFLDVISGVLERSRNATTWLVLA